MNLNKLTSAQILIFGFLFLVTNVFSQPLKVSIKVNSTVQMKQVEPFEVIPENRFQTAGKDFTTKTRLVNAMGAFIIQGKENSIVLVQLDAPSVLTNKENVSMSFDMSLACHNNTACDVKKLEFNKNKKIEFQFSKVADGTGTTKNDEQSAFLYLKGTVDVPINSQSPPEGNILLTIEY